MKTPESNQKRILVVDDEPTISDICQRVLTREGFDVDIAVNSKVARDMIAEKQYDLLLVDVMTPVMTGIELYQWLQEEHPQLASRLIFDTGSVVARDITTFVEQSGRPLLPKPFTPEELKAIVTETLKEAEK